MLIKVKNNQALSLYYLVRYALKFVYEPENMSSSEIDLMQSSIISWSNKIKLDKEMNRVRESEEHLLQDTCFLLDKNEDGKLDRRKALFKETGVDYKKFHKLPEAFTEKDFFAAQEEYEKLKAINPEEN